MMLPRPFLYPSSIHSRRHGPAGYQNYESFKEWLRDEFSFRCVYCLFRERWYPNGSMSFSIDHVIPRSVDRGGLIRAGLRQPGLRLQSLQFGPHRRGRPESHSMFAR